MKGRKKKENEENERGALPGEMASESPVPEDEVVTVEAVSVPLPSQ